MPNPAFRSAEAHLSFQCLCTVFSAARGRSYINGTLRQCVKQPCFHFLQATDECLHFVKASFSLGGCGGVKPGCFESNGLPRECPQIGDLPITHINPLFSHLLYYLCFTRWETGAQRQEASLFRASHLGISKAEILGRSVPAALVEAPS